ncbi:PilN domain-containing protein [Aeoliella sp. SH292]|uniref:PilN domain-containing protein n=1 Tax=Aeoliella sp. SH292 TaxID=3454464 RepID=UPI003F9B6C5A
MKKQSTDTSPELSRSDRRAARPDRRSGSDRRRNVETKRPIIHIARSMLRVLVVVERSNNQQDLAICRSLAWRMDADRLHSLQGAKELTAALAKLAGEERLAGAEAEVLLSSDLCVTRAVTGVVDDVQRETASLRERSQLYLSLGPGKKVIASSSTPLDARHAHAMLTVATEQTLQIISQAIESAGMELGAIRSAQVSLARAVHQVLGADAGASLVVGVDGGNIELGIMSRGRLFLDYRPGGDAHVDDLAGLLGQHHTRLQRYCHRHHGLEGSKLTDVLVSGQSDEARPALKNLETIEFLKSSLLDLQGVTLPWELRGEPLAPEMAAAVGAALALAGDVSTRGPNLVDHLKSLARPNLRPMLIRKLAPLAAVLLIAVGLGVLNCTKHREVSAMQQQLVTLAPKAERAAKLRVDLVAGENEVAQYNVLASHLRSQPYALLLKNLTQSVPTDVWLSDVRFEEGGTATIAGSSYVESSIYDFVSNLQHLPGIGGVALHGTGVGRTAHRNATTFDIHFHLDFSGESTPAGESL